MKGFRVWGGFIELQHEGLEVFQGSIFFVGASSYIYVYTYIYMYMFIFLFLLFQPKVRVGWKFGFRFVRGYGVSVAGP